MSNDGIISGETRGWQDLGSSSELKSAELVAGMQAVTFPSEEWDYLSTPVGRWFAQFFFNMIKNRAVANATGARNLCLTSLAEEVLSAVEAPRLIVEIGTLLSARGLKLAQKFPGAQVIEIGLPQIIDAKVERLTRYLGGSLPANIAFIKSDVRKQPLGDILKNQLVDLVIAEGFLPFCPKEKISEIAVEALRCLRPTGSFIGDVISSSGWKGVQGLNMMATITLSRQTGQFQSQFEDISEVKNLFHAAGFPTVNGYALDHLARKYLPQTVTANISLLIDARKN